jgi:hypothetical protein
MVGYRVFKEYKVESSIFAICLYVNVFQDKGIFLKKLFYFIIKLKIWNMFKLIEIEDFHQKVSQIILTFCRGAFS